MLMSLLGLWWVCTGFLSECASARPEMYSSSINQRYCCKVPYSHFIIREVSQFPLLRWNRREQGVGGIWGVLGS